MTAKPDNLSQNLETLEQELRSSEAAHEHALVHYLIGVIASATDPAEWQRFVALAAELNRKERAQHVARRWNGL